jgi:serine/threonine protein kinase
MANPNMLTNEYRLLRRVGRGGMGEVWEAVRIKGSGIVVPCAIKLLHADITETAREHKLFLDEARIATQLDHGRIVKIIDIGTARDGRPFLVMERVDGVDLRGFLEAAKAETGGLLDLDVVVYIIGEVLAGLAYAHGRKEGGADGGIVHSDVTPGNIMVTSSGEVKLTDFGIARFAATAGPMSRAVGTPRYMSPEQLSGDPQRETDIYGLGVVLHELLEGKRFLDGFSPDQFRSRVLMGPPPKLSREGVPAWLDELREWMIATDPKARPRADEARAILVKHCPGFVAAGTQLEAQYARIIGGQRSGVTLLKMDDVGAKFGEEEASGNVELTELLPATSPQPTELLPATGPDPSPGPESVRTTTGPVAEPPSMTRRWLAITGSLALALGLVVIVLLVKILREPAAVDRADVQDTAHLVTTPQPSVPQPSTPEPRLTEPWPTEPRPTEPLAATKPEATVTPEPPAPSEPTEIEKAPDRPKSSPKPALPKIGVLFFVETNQEGQLQIGRKTVAVKNRSAYMELAPGKHRISWQPAGRDDWQLQGEVMLEDISPSRYKVRLADGKVVEVGKL